MFPKKIGLNRSFLLPENHHTMTVTLLIKATNNPSNIRKHTNYSEAIKSLACFIFNNVYIHEKTSSLKFVNTGKLQKDLTICTNVDTHENQQLFIMI
jgi:hypothetical protein